ncbi:hypothetical protein QTG54_003747 [Skeletonema marinoi]|uniref:Bifunctional inhibitor/plant lipid transfer protein/seed storage helical domain-containing protein n=1 Tax=Skeletonema marinoi TaxID=267567 RepID=A0AAD8YGG6_9STRA|nr:hypothetical protein QTG54_003747 [Skeletonema marinoi]
MQLRPSLLLSTAAAALISMPLAAQGEFLQCVMQNLGLILPLMANTTELTGAVSSLCCGETDDPTCAALQCLDFETMLMVEPCTCSDMTGALEGMKADTGLMTQISAFLPNLVPQSEAATDACCASDETTATEVNTCVATLDWTTLTGTTEAATTTGATEPAATTGATEATTTSTAAAVPVPAPATAPSSGNIASVSLPIMVAYTIFNYVM